MSGDEILHHNKFFRNIKRGFTLIELLIVIIIIAILGGIILIAIDPAMQRTRASATALKTNTIAVCRTQAMCLSASTTGGAGCNTMAEIGMPEPGNPVGATYTFGAVSPWLVTGTWLSGEAGSTQFTMTCQNIDATLSTFGRVSCATNGETIYTCSGFGLQ